MTTQICGHEVKWGVTSKSVKELPDFEVERISYLLGEGFHKGELNITFRGKNGRHYETTGWWEIIDWQSIALELYNVLKSVGPNSFAKKDKELYKKAIDKFDKNWD